MVVEIGRGISMEPSLAMIFNLFSPSHPTTISKVDFTHFVIFINLIFELFVK